MASALQSAVTSIQMNNYGSLAIVTAIVYDYILTFSDEMEYIWKKPWTWVSTLFVLVRYIGLYNIITASLLGTSFVPGPAELYVLIFTFYRSVTLLGKIVSIFFEWAGFIFICAADLAMLLRVWAMYNRSRLILCTLLTFYAFEIISNVVLCILYSTKNAPIVTTAQVLDFTFCTWQNDPALWSEIADISEVTLGAVMCLLLVLRFTRGLLQMYRATKRFYLNHYISLLVREGMLYFLSILLWSLINLMYNKGVIPQAGWWALFYVPQCILPFPLVPRFILGLRELYARDLGGRYGSDVDTAFGLSTTRIQDTAGSESAIEFVDASTQDEGLEAEEIQMEEGFGENDGGGSMRA